MCACVRACVRACMRVCMGGWVGVWVCVACAVVDTDVFTYLRKSMQLFLSFLLIG